MPDTQQEIANSFAAVSAAWLRTKFSPEYIARFERSKADDELDSNAWGTTNVHNIRISATSDDAPVLKRVYFSARVIPDRNVVAIMPSEPFCPLCFYPLLRLSSLSPLVSFFFAPLPASRISIRRGETCHCAVDKATCILE